MQKTGRIMLLEEDEKGSLSLLWVMADHRDQVELIFIFLSKQRRYSCRGSSSNRAVELS